MRADECVQFFRDLRDYDNQAQEGHAETRTVHIFEKFFVVDRNTRVLVGTVDMVDLLLAEHTTLVEVCLRRALCEGSPSFWVSFVAPVPAPLRGAEGQQKRSCRTSSTCSARAMYTEFVA